MPRPKFKDRRRGLQRPEPDEVPAEKPLTPDPETDAGTHTVAPQEIPPHVWALLQESGERAAMRLLEMLSADRFQSYSAAVRARLIDLALTRAYGLPVRRSVSVDLTSNDADAVAAALNDLTSKLPERAAQGRAQGSDGQVIDITPPNDT